MGENSIYLIDFVMERLDKINLERSYCSRFMYDAVKVDCIRANVSICSNEDLNLLHEKSFELRDEGYPQTKISIKDKHPDWDGTSLHSMLEVDSKETNV